MSTSVHGVTYHKKRIVRLSVVSSKYTNPSPLGAVNTVQGFNGYYENDTQQIHRSCGDIHITRCVCVCLQITWHLSFSTLHTARSGQCLALIRMASKSYTCSKNIYSVGSNTDFCELRDNVFEMQIEHMQLPVLRSPPDHLASLSPL